MSALTINQRLSLYFQLVRLDKPIGILLLLWPTLWGLWIAAEGWPGFNLLAIFIVGTVLMRSAGCAINDWADRDFDKHVKRTALRPLTSGKISHKEALSVALFLTAISFSLILPLNDLTKQLSVFAAFIAGVYPFTKRFFAMPQGILGVAFGMGIPMAFAAIHNHVPPVAWILLLANVFWAIGYDTAYAMVDRDDDVLIGIKTSAITFGRFDILAINLCHSGFIVLMGLVGLFLHLNWPFFMGLIAAVGMMIYHHTLLVTRERQACFQVFLENNRVGGLIFLGTMLSFMKF
jgi:4-hydroxybenzoate polyprenyltransferase